MKEEEKLTLILGASNNTTRYAYLAAESLIQKGLDFIPVGIKKGDIFGKTIINNKSKQSDIHTVTMYINPQRQVEWYEYILDLKPKRIIFNPGTENPELMKLARDKGIETVFACTLVMLSTGQY